MTVQDLYPQGSGPAVRDSSEYSSKRAARGVKPPVTSVATGPSGAFGTISGLFQGYEQLGYYLPWELLDFIELLARFNPDYSQAVANIQTLANSGHDVYVEAATDLQQRKVTALVSEKSHTIQARNGGIDGLIDKLLHQAAVFGAMCGEWVVSDDLTEVVDFADVSPKTIRFFWNETLETWEPYQKVSALHLERAKARGQHIINQCIKLNPETFHYYAFNAAPNSPYGTPPFLAALEPLAIQKDMTVNMAQIVKKLGLLGIIDVAVKQLPVKPGETPDAYQQRAGAYLDELVEAVEDMVRDGGMVHYDDLEAQTYNIAGNAAGATAIFKQNEEQVFSGLNSMPSVQGRSYSTTETYAGVAYDIIIRNTIKYQRACKRMLESGYRLMTAMEGLNPDRISIHFKPNKTLHRLQDAQAESLELKNALTKWAMGINNQKQAAQELGYTTVATEYEEIPDSPILGSAGNVNAEVDTDTQPTGDGKPDNANDSKRAGQQVVLSLEEYEELVESSGGQAS